MSCWVYDAVMVHKNEHFSIDIFTSAMIFEISITYPRLIKKEMIKYHPLLVDTVKEKSHSVDLVHAERHSAHADHTYHIHIINA
jgi:hypothetical protein